jgi:hypothetical protein
MKDEPVRDATYELVVRGELDTKYGFLFEGMDLQRADGTTVLTGDVRDQAQLHGLLERIEELGLPLLSVQRVDTTRPDDVPRTG